MAWRSQIVEIDADVKQERKGDTLFDMRVPSCSCKGEGGVVIDRRDGRTFCAAGGVFVIRVGVYGGEWVEFGGEHEKFVDLFGICGTLDEIL